MAKKIALSDAEFEALATVDGTRSQPKMSIDIEARLRGLDLVERREWPNGPLWRSAAGDRLRKGSLKASRPEKLSTP